LKDEPSKPTEDEVKKEAMTDEEPKKKTKAKSKSKSKSAKGKAKSKAKGKSAKGKAKDEENEESEDGHEAKVEKKTETKKSSKGKAKGKAKASAKTESKSDAGDSDTVRSVMINRAPVLTLWVAVVAQRMGYSWNSGLTFGRLVAGWFAKAKGTSLGLMQSSEKTKEQREKEKGQYYEVNVFGRKLPVRDVSGEPMGISKGKPIKPATIQTYIENAFGEKLVYVKEAMEMLAASYSDTNELNSAAYDLYTEFRPPVASGAGGWGKKAKLDLDAIRAMAARQ
jgi:hypothetical protein